MLLQSRSQDAVYSETVQKKGGFRGILLVGFSTPGLSIEFRRTFDEYTPPRGGRFTSVPRVGVGVGGIHGLEPIAQGGMIRLQKQPANGHPL